MNLIYQATKSSFELEDLEESYNMFLVDLNSNRNQTKIINAMPTNE